VLKERIIQAVGKIKGRMKAFSIFRRAGAPLNAADRLFCGGTG